MATGKGERVRQRAGGSAAPSGLAHASDELRDHSWRQELARALKEDEYSSDVSIVWGGILDFLTRTVPAARATDAGADLSGPEALALARGSADLNVSRTTTAGVLARSAGNWADLLRESAGVPDVARRLAVQESRVRQRLAARTIYGFKHDNSWYIPPFQFYRDQLLPGIDTVIPRLPHTAAPLAVASWFMTPTSDLAQDERAVSPREWLIGGGEADTVAALAAEL